MTTLTPTGGKPDAPIGAGGRPIGFWPTIGWLSTAALAALLFVFSLLGSYELIFGQLPNEFKIEQDLTPCIYIVLLTVLIEIVRYAGWSAKNYFALAMPTRLQIALAVVAGATFPFIDNVVGIFDSGPPDVSAYIDYNKAMVEGLLPLQSLNVIFIGPAAEEAIFRGFLYRGWSQTRLNHSGTIVLTAILFGIAHFQYDWFGMISIAISGLLLGWLRWWSGSLVAPILAHAANNAVVTAVFALAD